MVIDVKAAASEYHGTACAAISVELLEMTAVYVAHHPVVPGVDFDVYQIAVVNGETTGQFVVVEADFEAVPLTEEQIGEAFAVGPGPCGVAPKAAIAIPSLNLNAAVAFENATYQ